MKVKLVILHARAAKREVLMAEFPAPIGRSASANVHLDDRCVSREHCEIDELGGGLVIRDKGSRHGTFVNGSRVDRTVLFPGDRITIGETRMLVCELTTNAGAEARELKDECESGRYSERTASPCRSTPTNHCRQNERPSLMRSLGRMLTGHGRKTGSR